MSDTRPYADRLTHEARLQAFTEIHEYWEFAPGVTEASFDDWLHAEIRRLKTIMEAPPLPTGETPAERVDDADTCARCSHPALWHSNFGAGECQVRTGCDCYEFKRHASLPAAPVPGDRLRELVGRLENYYDFECTGGPLKNCVEWRELRAVLATVSPRDAGETT